jgi:aldehyde dehydrogenase (NAD+)
MMLIWILLSRVVAGSIYFNQGEVCCAGPRLLVQAAVSTQLLEKIKRHMRRLRVGDPLDKFIDIGALVIPAQQQRIVRLVEQSLPECDE